MLLRFGIWTQWFIFGQFVLAFVGAGGKYMVKFPSIQRMKSLELPLMLRFGWMNEFYIRILRYCYHFHEDHFPYHRVLHSDLPRRILYGSYEDTACHMVVRTFSTPHTFELISAESDISLGYPKELNFKKTTVHMITCSQQSGSHIQALSYSCCQNDCSFYSISIHQRRSVNEVWTERPHSYVRWLPF